MHNSQSPGTYQIQLELIEVTNNDLYSFLLLTQHPEPQLPYDVNRYFEFNTEDNIHFTLRLGFSKTSSHASVSLDFECPLDDIDLSIFDQTASPIFSNENLTAWSREAVVIQDAQEAQRKKIENEIHALLPLVARALNTFNEACKLVLYQDITKLDFLAQGFRRKTEDLGGKVGEDLGSATFLFAAFPNRGAARLAQEVNIRYRIEDHSGRSFEDQILGLRGGYPAVVFAEKYPDIQEQLNRGWSVTDIALLTAVEFIYADNYRMAVFNAATVLERVVEGFFRTVVNSDPTGQKLEREIKKGKSRLKFIFELVPKYMGWKLVQPQHLDLCLSAWKYRNSTAAHLTTGQAERKLSQSEAWDMVTSIILVVEEIRTFGQKSQLG